MEDNLRLTMLQRCVSGLLPMAAVTRVVVDEHLIVVIIKFMRLALSLLVQGRAAHRLIHSVDSTTLEALLSINQDLVAARLIQEAVISIIQKLDVPFF